MKNLTFLLLIAAALFPIGAAAQGISQLQQFTATTSPAAAITQTVFGKAFRLTGQTSGCAQFSANGTLTSTGVVCGSGGGGASFAYPFPSNATTTLIEFNGGASTTLFSSAYASSTLYYGADLQACNATTGKLTWSSGRFACGTDTDTTYTAGDAITLTGNDFDFDGGATPSGDLSGTWASPSVTDDSHAHTGATLSGIDISSDTNLQGDSEIVLTGDVLSIASSIARDSELHAAVTLAGEDFLTLSTQQITANAIDPDNLSASDFGDFTCNGTTCSLDATYVQTSRTLTVAGTANQIISSVGAQSLAADRTWTLTLPAHVIFPGNFQVTNATATNATTTSLNVTGQVDIDQLTSALIVTGAGGILAEYAGSTNPCTNQLPTTISVLGALGSCVSITDSFISGQIGLSHGGSNATLSGANQVITMNAGNTALTNEAAFTYTQSTDNLAFLYASSTSISTSLGAWLATGGGSVGIGTTTPAWLTQINGTRPSLALSDSSAGVGLRHWVFSSMGGNLYIGTSTNAFGTSTLAALSILNKGQVSTTEAPIATSTTMTIDWATTPNQVDVQILGAAMTIGFNSASSSGMTKRVVVCNGGVSASTVTWVGPLWAGGTAPTQTTTANKCDVYSFIVTQASSTAANVTKVFGTQTGNF